MAKTTPQPHPIIPVGKTPHVYDLIVQLHQSTPPASPSAQDEIIVTLGGSAFYTYPYRT